MKSKGGLTFKWAAVAWGWEGARIIVSELAARRHALLARAGQNLIRAHSIGMILNQLGTLW